MGDPKKRVTKRAKRIALVVDDDETLREVLREVLEKSGFRVFTACSGEDALVHLEARKHLDVILSDQDMGRVNGLQVIGASMLRFPEAIHLLMTGGECAEVKHRAESLGAIYLEKPFSLMSLIAAVRSSTEEPA
jgi:DNA-binding NtrC family response regulator